MLKYTTTDIVFQEVPDEVTLAVNISNCPCHCPGCHSQYLAEDVGNELNEESIDGMIAEFGRSMTCLCFMGGDAEPEYVNSMASYVRNRYPQFHVGWYTGRVRINSAIDKANFDYIKVGPFIRHLGPLKSTTTNQRMYKILHPGEEMQDVTSWFWKK